jgi:Asp-tRNA(Asn)/Glu-tRNA(Gln) amidotransferase A subunit family amidase
VPIRQRIDALLSTVQAQNPALGAVSSIIAADAQAVADRLDALPRGQLAQLPLAGVPVVIKDLIDTPPACCPGGLAAFDDWFPQRAAEVVARLRDAGAIVIGVGATDNAGFGVRTRQVMHPLAPGHTVGGSSGGCAAAVAAGWVGAAIGTDTGGSIRIPAACCGVVGFKPTWGRVSTAGVRALVPSLDHVGPIAASVAEARAIMMVIDPVFAPADGAATRRLQGAAPPAGWSQLRVGVVRGMLDASAPEVAAAVSAVLHLLQLHGVRVKQAELPGDPLLDRLHQTVFCFEAAAAWATTRADHLRFARLPALVRDTLVAGLAISPVQYRRAMDARDRLRGAVEQQFQSVDLLLLPTLPVLAPAADARQVTIGHREQGFTRTLIEFTRLANHTGHPALSLPLPPRPGENRRAGLQMLAASGRDAWLLDVGEAFEAAIAVDAPGRAG